MNGESIKLSYDLNANFILGEVPKRIRGCNDSGYPQVDFYRGANISENKFMSLISSMIYNFTQLKKKLEAKSTNYPSLKIKVLGINSMSVHKYRVTFTIEKSLLATPLLAQGKFNIAQDVSRFLNEKLLETKDFFIAILGPKELTQQELNKAFLKVSKEEIWLDIFTLFNRFFPIHKKKVLILDEKEDFFGELLNTTELSFRMEDSTYVSAPDKLQVNTPTKIDDPVKSSLKKSSTEQKDLSNDQNQSVEKQKPKFTIIEDSQSSTLVEPMLSKGKSSTEKNITILESTNLGKAPSTSEGNTSKIKFISDSPLNQKCPEESKGSEPSSNSKSMIFSVVNKGVEIFKGELTEDRKRHGVGRYVYPNGDVYDGEWKDDKRHGRGMMFFKLGTRNELAGGYYEGEFVEDRIEGSGTFFNKNNVAIYKGVFKNNLKNGLGFLRDENGDLYYGEFSNGFKHGNGTQYTKNGPVYEGNWYCNKKHGEFAVYPKWEYEPDGKPTVTKSTIVSKENYVYDMIGIVRKAKITIVSMGTLQGTASNKTADISTQSSQNNPPIKELANRYGIRITTEDMITLDGKNPLGANIMNFYLRAVEAKSHELLYECNDSDIPRILFLDSDFFSELTMDNLESKNSCHDRVAMLFKAYSSPKHLIFNEFDKILFVVNKRGTHWVLAEITCEKEDMKLNKISFKIYDSIPQEDKEFKPIEDHVTRHLYGFAIEEARKIEKENAGESETIIKLLMEATCSYPKVPSQKDLCNCGVFVCKYLQYLALGREISFDVTNVSEFRNEIRNIILEVYHNPLVINRKHNEKNK